MTIFPISVTQKAEFIDGLYLDIFDNKYLSNDGGTVNLKLCGVFIRGINVLTCKVCFKSLKYTPIRFSGRTRITKQKIHIFTPVMQTHIFRKLCSKESTGPIRAASKDNNSRKDRGGSRSRKPWAPLPQPLPIPRMRAIKQEAIQKKTPFS